MGCIYSDFNGRCQNFDPDIDADLGCDEDGNCICEEDPEPDLICSSFEDDDPDDEDE